MMGWMAPLRHRGAEVLVGEKPPANREPSMKRGYVGRLTCGQRLHRAEANITKSGGQVRVVWDPTETWAA